MENGIKICEEVASELDLVFENYMVLDAYEDRVPDGLLGKKRRIMGYTLRKPWEALVMKGI